MLELIETNNTGTLVFFITIRAGIILICWLFMVVSSIVDFWSGITTAKALGQALMSHGFRRTITKICDYARLMLFALMFDILGSLLSFYIVPFATILCTAAIICIECKSVIENSRRKKTHVADIPEVIKSIMRATSQKDAKIILEQLTKK